MELRKIIRKKLNGMIFVVIMIAMLKGQVFAVSSEDLANPVRDVPTHSLEYEKQNEDAPHKTRYCYVYFGSYPQKEVSDTALINQLQNAKFDVNNDTSINGKKYRRMSWETMVSSGTVFGRTKESWDETSYNGYRYYRYEPIKWKILSNDGEKLFLFADNILDVQFFMSAEWENSPLRRWLNYDGKVDSQLPKEYKNKGFMCFAFSEEEQSRILTTHVIQDANPYFTASDGSPLIGGNDTEDKLFFLSYSEISNGDYGFCDTVEDPKTGFHLGICRSAALLGTDYATALKTPYRDRVLDHFWLRTRGEAPGYWMTCGGLRGGMSMSGWHYNDLNTSVAPACNVSFKTSDCIKISFDTNGAGEIESQILLGSNYAKEPAEPKKTGFAFSGWYMDKACTVPYEFNKKISSDTILYAKWRPYIKVSYQTNSGDIIQDQIIVEGNPAEEPLAPMKEGYVFTGWFMDEKCTIPYNFEQGLSADTILYAGWKQKELSKNETFKSKNVTYKVVSSSAKTVEYCKAFKTGSKTIKKVTIPATVSCKGVTYKVTVIGKNAFKNHKKLEKVTIGKNIKEIKANAFYGCKKLNKVTFKGTSVKTIGKNAFKGIYKRAVFNVPAKKYKAYKKLLKKKTGYKSTMRVKK